MGYFGPAIRSAISQRASRWVRPWSVKSGRSRWISLARTAARSRNWRRAFHSQARGLACLSFPRCGARVRRINGLSANSMVPEVYCIRRGNGDGATVTFFSVGLRERPALRRDAPPSPWPAKVLVHRWERLYGHVVVNPPIPHGERVFRRALRLRPRQAERHQRPNLGDRPVETLP